MKSKKQSKNISAATTKAKQNDRMRTIMAVLDYVDQAINRHPLAGPSSNPMTYPHGVIADMTYFPDSQTVECLWEDDDEGKFDVQTITLKFEGALESKDFRIIDKCTCHDWKRRTYCEHALLALFEVYDEILDSDSNFIELLTKGVKAEPNWDLALKKLDEFLSAKPAAEAPSTAPARMRLIWRLTSSTYRPISIEPIEQSPSKRGGWNKGKSVNWDRVLTRPNLDLSPADLEVMRIAKGSYHYWGPSDHKIGEVLERLIGHPYVFFDETPVTVVQGQMGLVLVDSEGTWKIVPGLNGCRIEAFNHFTIDESEIAVACDISSRKVYVARASEDMRRLVSEFLTLRPTIPPDVQAEFLKRLPALEARIPVSLPDSLKGEFIPADERLVLRLTPAVMGGAIVQFQVQPAPQGAFYTPGDGLHEVPGHQGELRVQVLRDHDQERIRADALFKELFLQRFPNTAPFTWSIASDDDVLDLLDILRARPEDDPRVLWPADQETPRLQVLGEVSPSALRVEVKDQHDWFGISGTIDIGGKQFPLTALLTALKGGRRYLDLGKGQFAAISQEFRNRLASISDMLHSNRGKLEFNSTAAPLLAELFENEVTLKASKKWKESLNRLKKATDLDPLVPSTLTADLRDYQVEGFKWLRKLAEWGVGGCLADDMGLGKTVQALALLLDRREVGPTLVVAPVSVGFNWMRETVRFAPTLRPFLYRDTDRADFLKTLGPGDLLITSYYLLQQHASDLTAIKWGTLVLDEAQAVKNSQTKTAQVVREIEADWRLALTGTPVENHLGELWSLFRAVSPGLFGSWERFREVFGDPIEKGKDSDRKQALSRVIRPFILRRTKSEVLTELPARTEIQLTAELSDAERRVYEDARLWAVTNLTNLMGENDKDQRFQVLAALTKLRQLACHPRLVDKTWDKSSAKLDLFLETIDELREGRHRALVFSQFTQHLALVREALDERKISYQYLDGSTPVKKRQEAVDAFQRDEGELFLISLKAGGTGLNLTGADYVVHLDPWWNPAVEDQATDRAHRIGQTRPVTVYRLVAKDTIEEQILKLHADKRGLVAGILEGTDAAAKLSTTELVDLIKLGGAQT
jgi:superfamily II DNA or RNA helicase